MNYVKNRVSLLEAVNFTSTSRRPATRQEQPKSYPRYQEEKRSKVALHTSKLSNTTSSTCLFCSKEHPSVRCSQFENLSIDARYQAARDKRICFWCLNSTHWSNRCKVTKPCDKCSGCHHTLLHKPHKETVKPLSPEVSMVSARDKSTVLLGTALVHVQDHTGCMQPVRALIDSASQISVMTTSCVERLGLSWVKWTVPLTGLSGVTVPSVDGLVKCTIAPRYDDHHIYVNAWILPKITGNMLVHHITPQMKFRSLSASRSNFRSS